MQYSAIFFFESQKVSGFSVKVKTLIKICAKIPVNIISFVEDTASTPCKGNSTKKRIVPKSHKKFLVLEYAYMHTFIAA